MDGKNGHGLKLEKVWASVFKKIIENIIMVSAPWWNLFKIFFIAPQEHFVYG